MLRITVEMWPSGDSSRRQEIATCDIVNTTGLAALSDYLAVWRTPGMLGKEVKVKRHRRTDGALVLLGRVFARLLGEQ